MNELAADWLNDIMRDMLFLPEQALDLRDQGRLPALLRRHRHDDRRPWRWACWRSPSSSATARRKRTPRPPSCIPSGRFEAVVIAVPLVFFLAWVCDRLQGLRLVHEPAQGRDGRLRDGQAVDVEVRLSRRPQRQRRADRARRTARCAC